MLIEFGEWLPDLARPGRNGTDYLHNVIPIGNHYEPFRGLAVFSGALNARPQGAHSTRDADGTVFNFSGNATKLYKLSGTTWSDVSKVGGYTTGADERWSFITFGRRVIATNYTDAIQSYLMGTSSVFANLSGSPPNARYIAAVKDFVVLGNTSDGVSGAVPHRAQWSALGDPTASWASDEATQADYQDLDSNRGFITQVVGGEYGVIFQERAIWRMTYAGSPLIFQFDKVEDNRGTQAPGSVVKVGNLIYYLGYDGFYVFDGIRSTPIGAHKVDNTLFAELDQNYLERVKGVADPRKPLIYWAVPVTSNTGGRPNAIYCYNYRNGRFSRIGLSVSIDMENIYTVFTAGYTLDSLDSVSSSIDALAYSLDSTEWTGGAINLAAFNSDHKLCYFTGSILDCFMRGPWLEPSPGYFTQITRMRPVVEAGTGQNPSITCGSVNKNAWHSGDIALSDNAVINAGGFANIRARARYHAPYCTITGNWQKAIGVEIIQMAKAGQR